VPVRVGVSIGDTLASLHGVIGILMALHHRHRAGVGQVIDVALYEAVFNCMESLLPEYSAFGAVREPAGSALPGIAPSNAYRCRDGGYALIAGNGDSIFRRLMAVIARTDLGRTRRWPTTRAAWRVWQRSTPPLASGPRSVLWTRCWPRWTRRAVPAGRIYTVADIAADPHYQARGMIGQVQMDDGTQLAVPGIVPKLSLTPGVHRRNAPTLGQDTDAVLREVGLTDAQIAALRERGIVAGACT
jgi:formyl-CoA transferase